ncbi:MAG: termination factor Rho [Gammaproteobacteria bacterium]|nr:MAG: termination factor Rho [Gammaproteobacteria bacterium]
MPRGSKEKYSPAQKKKAEHIEAGYEHKGVPKKKAEAIAWATVNKQSGGGEKSGSGKTTSSTKKAKAREDSAHNAVKTKHAKASSDSLESHTKAELLEQARSHNISGRSTMNKQELILALRKPK